MHGVGDVLMQAKARSVCNMWKGILLKASARVSRVNRARCAWNAVFIAILHDVPLSVERLHARHSEHF